MKTFVAEGILCDYTCGMVVVTAENLEHAKQIIDDKFEFDSVKNEIKENLEELEVGEYLDCWGGG